MLTLTDFQAAAERLKNVVHAVPLSTSSTFSAMSGAEVYLKYENQQKTGSFKVRGAYNKIMKRYEEGGLHAVVASSAGNHAQGVAFAASSIGVPATIVMPRSAPIAKVSATEGFLTSTFILPYFVLRNYPQVWVLYSVKKILYLLSIFLSSNV